MTNNFSPPPQSLPGDAAGEASSFSQHSPDREIQRSSDYRAGRQRGIRDAVAACVAGVALLAIGFVMGFAVGHNTSRQGCMLIAPAPIIHPYYPGEYAQPQARDGRASQNPSNSSTHRSLQ